MLEVYIGYLRRKLGEVDGADPIETVRNVGYRLRVPVVRRLVPGGLRTQLALAIALITLLAVGLSFLGDLSGTGSRLRDRIDSDLTAQVGEWEQFSRGTIFRRRAGSSGLRAASSRRRATTRPHGSS